MAYSKTTWVNDNAPALNATNLNKIEQGIYDNASDIDTINTTLNAVADYITEQGTSGDWTYRKWNSGMAEAWYEYSGGSATYTTWTSPIRYRDMTFSLPSGLFNAAPKILASSNNNQVWAVGITGATATGFGARFATVSSSAVTTNAYFYAIGTWE